MGRYPVARDFEGDDFFVALHRDQHLGAGGPFHAAYHAVLGEVNSGDDGGVHFKQTVSRQHTDLFRRAAGNDFNDYRGIVGHVKLNAYTGEIARQVLFRRLEFAGRHIDGMRVQVGQDGDYCSLGELLAVDGIDVVLVYSLENEVELTPVVVGGAIHTPVVAHTLETQHESRPEQNARKYRDKVVPPHFNLLFLLLCLHA